ncbi:hypothetical protein [Botryobacter ruber]|uniref:hypothetical protein n=1 Tax=Botryobacter ruber TaxID=2171629 RepID=UPI000E0A3ACC|nr:hypothetical protein [Botryobacter ruber]
MKKLMALSLLFFGLMFGSHATGKNPLVEKRASNLSNRMIRGLRLNNYQSTKIREINSELAAKMLAVEEAYAGNQQMIDQKMKEIYAERDHALERVLSTAQYNSYYGNRKVYNQEDKEFMASLRNGTDTEQQAESVASVDKTESNT